MKTVFDKFENFKGVQFVGLHNYLNSKGELANHVINVGPSVINAKEKDLETLQNLTIDELYVIAKKYKVDKKEAETALSEMILSAKKNLSADMENRTAQSQGQTNAYITLNSGMSLNLDTKELYLNGFSHSKEIIVEGEYKEKNFRSGRTLLKDKLPKELELRMTKFRRFKFKNLDEIAVTGDTLTVL